MAIPMESRDVGTTLDVDPNGRVRYFGSIIPGKLISELIRPRTDDRILYRAIRTGASEGLHSDQVFAQFIGAAFDFSLADESQHLLELIAAPEHPAFE
jgi:hypothetical protein